MFWQRRVCGTAYSSWFREIDSNTVISFGDQFAMLLKCSFAIFSTSSAGMFDLRPSWASIGDAGCDHPRSPKNRETWGDRATFALRVSTPGKRSSLISPQPIVLVVIRERRHLDFGDGVRLQLVEDQLHALFELLVVACGVVLGQELDFDVGRDAFVLDFPVAFEPVDGVARSHDVATVEQSGIAADADESAPGARAHQLAHAGLAEVPRVGVAARAGVLIDEHHLGAEDG